eukprot:CAMPEP_0201486458 /NCGR_PEP_ID=MMETSP0151_2-20130828/10522_1 /ASSEMBLY_ACC=CAM_ASM_000257 /TAXON_ID=200890 /ORGANISM="Paramoeba atlantica, Strain 621/1 / CCAP 1560/9" /LENGTH=281 /DNA_ID=CAMNT_0047871117 /DNA_START=101 /DNA_END=946 /DNA_ORIENTATION=-
MDLLMRQLEGRTPLTKGDVTVRSYAEEFGRPAVSPTLHAKYGWAGKYASEEYAQISDLATRDELQLNTYPQGDSKGLTFNIHDESTITTNYYASYDEEFFRKHILKPRRADPDRDLVCDLALNASLTGLFLLWVRYLIAPFYWLAMPPMKAVNQSNIEVDIGVLDEKECKTVVWRGKPVYVYHRTEEQIRLMEETPMRDLKHPEKDSDRFPVRPDHTVMIAICTHLGCIPFANEGIYSGYFCPCHGSHYDISGRIRMGPAPLNLEVPPYKWIDDTTLYIGS